MAPPSSSLVSIAIPCYEMHGRGAGFLEVALGQVAIQSYPLIEVVVADHSKDRAVAQVCERWSDRIDLRYVRNAAKRGSSSANVNVAIKNCRGQLIKILCQDDHLYDETAIDRTVGAFGAEDAWLVTSYLHVVEGAPTYDRHDPRLTSDIAVSNTIGTHSCLTIRNTDDPELFDENLLWMMDSEYYRRLYERFGPPAILGDVTVVQVLWDGQVTNTYAAEHRLRRAEFEIVRHRYPEPLDGLPESDQVVEGGGEGLLDRLRRVVGRRT